VAHFLPEIPAPAVFDADDMCRNLILTKRTTSGLFEGFPDASFAVINGHTASQFSPGLKACYRTMRLLYLTRCR
jgi:hypothetical protein